MEIKIVKNILVLLGLCVGFAGSSWAVDDDNGRFIKVKRDDLMKRTFEQIGNKFSVKHIGMRILKPQLQGTGCSDEEVAVALSEDKRKISILFNNYVVQAGSSVGKSQDLKSCNINLPVMVPAGHRVAVVALDYRGFASVPGGGLASLKTKYQFVSPMSMGISRRVVRNEDFVGPFEDSYYLTSSLKAQKYWSECGRNMVLKIETDLSAQTNSSSLDTLATLDSVDGQSTEDLTYHLLWEKCLGPLPHF